MMSNFKFLLNRTLSFLLTVFMSVSSFTINVFAENETDFITYAANTLKEIDNIENPLGEFIGIEEIYNNIYSGRTKVDMVLNVKDVKGYSDEYDLYLKLLKGAGLKYSVMSDMQKGKMLLNLEGNYKSKLVGDFVLYSDGEKIIYGLPSLHNEYFYYDSNYIDLNQYYNSKSLMLNNIANNYYSQNKLFLYNLLKSIKLNSIDNRVFSVSGEDKSFRGFNVYIPKDSIDNLIDNVYEFIMNDDEFNKYLFEELCYGMEDYYDYYRQSLNELHDTLISTSEDINFTIYVDDNDRIISVSYNDVIKGYDEQYINGEINFLGKNNIFDNIKGNLNISSNAIETSVNIDSNLSLDSNIQNTNVNLSMKNSFDENFNITYNSNFNYNNSNFDTLFLINAFDNNKFEISAVGNLNNVQKGKSYNLDFDSIKISIDDLIIDLDGKISYTSHFGDIEAPSQYPTNAENLDYDAMEEIYDEIWFKIKENIINIISESK